MWPQFLRKKLDELLCCAFNLCRFITARFRVYLQLVWISICCFLHVLISLKRFWFKTFENIILFPLQCKVYTFTVFGTYDLAYQETHISEKIPQKKVLKQKWSRSVTISRQRNISADGNGLNVSQLLQLMTWCKSNAPTAWTSIIEKTCQVGRGKATEATSTIWFTLLKSGC